MKNINEYIKAKFNIIMVMTREEDRLIGDLKTQFPTLEIIPWSFSRGVNEKEEKGEPVHKVLQVASEHNRPAIFVLKDYQPFLKMPQICAMIKDLHISLRKKEVWIVMTAAKREIPAELSDIVKILDYDLPDKDYLISLVKRAAKAWGQSEEVNVEAVADALSGLSEVLASDALAYSWATTKSISVPAILQEKSRLMAQDSTLETLEPIDDLSCVAGCDELISWLVTRRRAFSEEARTFGLPVPRGILLVGVPGAGKSLIAKAVAKSWGLPLLKCDVGALFAGIVGATEANVRKMIKTAEASAPCILFLDELEKGLSASMGQSSGDSGVSARVLGTLISWLQDKTKPVFVVATANRPESLPPEMLRRGRWDEIWALDLPNPQGRKEIFRVHINKRKRDVSLFNLDALVACTDGFTGAEIEAVVIDGLYTAFNEGKADMDTDDIIDACTKTVPLSKAAGSEIETMRAWARGRARNAAGVAKVETKQDDRFNTLLQNKN